MPRNRYLVVTVVNAGAVDAMRQASQLIKLFGLH
jgi:hypothetical protein